MSANDFINKISDFHQLSDKQQIVYIAYYLTSEKRAPFTASDIELAFSQDLKLKPPRSISSVLSKESKLRGGRGSFIKAKGLGYELDGRIHSDLTDIFENIPELRMFDKELGSSIALVKNNEERVLLEEAMRCYRVGSNRAMVILTWIVGLYHIEKYTLAYHKADFNTALTKHPDKRLNKLAVQIVDDFTEIKESTLIELLRSAGIISKSVRNMMTTRLSERNAAAHPSAIEISAPHAIAFGHDIVKNIILKY